MSPAPDDIQVYVDFAKRLAEAARNETLRRFRTGADVFNKAGIWYDPVTDADREAERVVRRLIKAAFPNHGIVGEEFGAENEDAALRWVLDPVDGTRAYVCGIASWATLIALEFEKSPIIGLIDQPYTDEVWLGRPDGAEFVSRGETKPCRTSDVTEISKARLTTTDPRRVAYFTSNEAAAFETVADQARLVRFSLDAYGYGLLALGELDLVIEAGLQRHDFAALAPVVTGAGGVITNWRGEPFGSDDRGRVVAAATPQLHEAALTMLSDAQVA